MPFLPMLDISHLVHFQPLIYQVSTADLSAPEMAQPILSILSRRKDVTVLMEEARDRSGGKSNHAGLLEALFGQ